MYDLIIVGAGPAGLTASIFSQRKKMKTLVLDAKAAGGYLLVASEIENYPGYSLISGAELAQRMIDQAKHFGAEIKVEQVIEFIDLDKKIKKVKTDKGEYEAPAIIIATGASHRSLGIKGEKEFLGKGVSFCATCDAFFFKNKTVAVVGGGNSAFKAANYLCDIASKVYLIHRSEFNADEIEIEKLKSKKNAEFVLDSSIKEIKGNEVVNSIIIKNLKDNTEKEIAIDGLFVYIGLLPTSSMAEKAGVKLDERNFIITDKKQRTNMPCVYAAGDITGNVLQVVVACSEGAIAALQAYSETH